MQKSMLVCEVRNHCLLSNLKRGLYRGCQIALLLNAFCGFLVVAAFGMEIEDEANIRQFVEHYFEVWSEQDMKGYKECFIPDAIVTYVDSVGRTVSLSRDRFVETQVQAHQQSSIRMREVAEDVQIRQDRDIAMALVRWRLMKKKESIRGVDAFILLKTLKGWRIIYLAFKTDSNLQSEN